ncbi:hypothetical protein [Hyphomicrobium sp. ghe19]|uniref:hypothetical protein n=1 Tax=Hyphomicrobium sp. ghe19 TaxID=2682968 RepID=UPI001366E219|nr:hypothetical protein HYPP_03802 [Hyphomicrobium sp. ghe19]
MPLVTGSLEGIPWTYRIPAMAITACAVLFLWRHLTLRRLLLPGIVQKIYENDLLTLGELFAGRSRVTDITFRGTEFRGPGAVYIEANCRITEPLYSPHLDTLIILPQNNASLLPFYRISNSVFDRCVFSSVGLLVDRNNYSLFGLPDPPDEPRLPLEPPRSVDLQNVDEVPPATT